MADELKKIKCIVCDNVFKNRCFKKCLLSEPRRIQKFLTIVDLYKDHVFERISHLQNVQDIVMARVYYHSECLRNYERVHEREQQQNYDIEVKIDNVQGMDEHNCVNDPEPNVVQDFDQQLEDIVKKFLPKLFNGEICSLTDLTEDAKATYCDPSFRNRQIKSLLERKYPEIKFVTSSIKKKPTLIYHSSLTFEKVIEKLYYTTNSTVKTAGHEIRECLQKVDFDLEDKFCDEKNLRKSWNSVEIPPPVSLFFSTLLNVNTKTSSTCNESLDEESITEKPSQKKNLIAKSIFQILYYAVHSGRKKTPLHILSGMTIHNTCKSSSLIKIFNRIGVSISYEEVLRHRTSLALLTVDLCRDIVPLPLHFDKSKFTVVAFDNFDHDECTLSGLDSTHDTVSVLFQEKSFNDRETRKISSTSIDPKQKVFNVELPCQVLQNFNGPSKKIALPANYKTTEFSCTEDLYKVVNIPDLCWMLCRDGTPGLQEPDSVQNVPSWAPYNSLVNFDSRPLQVVGFLPVLPHPVTEYSSVYTALCNFLDILRQLDQKKLAVFCDEGVYKIAIHLKFLCPEKFEKLVIMLGGFHMCKVLLACIGRYLKGSGVDLMFIETETFGSGVTEQVFKGTNYARSVKGFLLLGEVLLRLQLQSFFKTVNSKDFNMELSVAEVLRDTIIEQNYDESKILHEQFQNSCRNLYVKFLAFVELRCAESPLFKYWSNVLKLIQLLRDHIRAERLGDFDLHIQTLKKSQAIFHVFDHTHYVRYSGLYLQDMLSLPDTAPELYEEFKKGYFTVKRKNIPFTSVATDQALEQTINRAQKSSSGIIGSTKKKQFVAAWELIFHEMLAINNLFEEITQVKNLDFELQTHHDLSQSKTENTEVLIGRLMTYMTDKLNPFKEGIEPLRNIITEELCSSDAQEALLNLFEVACKIQNKFQRDRFQEKTSSLSDPIKRINFPAFKVAANNRSVTKPTSILKETKISQRIIDLAKERSFSLEKLFTYELANTNWLFDENNMIKKVPKKSDLLLQLEAKIDKDNIVFPKSITNFCLIVDVMYVCRLLKWKKLLTFFDFGTCFCQYVSHQLNGQISRIDFIFDIYLQFSAKDSERLFRYGVESIELHQIANETPMPVQEKLFWSSSHNKKLLQSFLRTFIFTYGRFVWPDLELICSATDENMCESNLVGHPDSQSLNALQRRDIEEADTRIFLHLNQAVIFGKYTHAFILTTDTDILVLGMYFFHRFRNAGLQELWARAGSSKFRHVPIHLLARTVGEALCSCLPTIHHLTGADYTSKIGTKRNALLATPENYLMTFARDIGSLDNDLANAEMYLIKVLSLKHESTTFDSLRYSLYRLGKGYIISDLPPTSASIRLHILRAFFAVYGQIHCLEAAAGTLDPLKFGYYKQDDYILPKMVENNLYPPIDELVPNCTCKKCARKTCYCVQAGLPCISFCACQNSSSCQNKFKAI